MENKGVYGDGVGIDLGIKKQAKDGISFQDTKNAAQEFTKNLSKQIDTVMQKEKYKTTFQANEAVTARA